VNLTFQPIASDKVHWIRKSWLFQAPETKNNLMAISDLHPSAALARLSAGQPLQFFALNPRPNPTPGAIIERHHRAAGIKPTASRNKPAGAPGG